MEIEESAALAWIEAYIVDKEENQELKSRLLGEFQLYQENLCQTAKKTYNNLLKLI